MNIVFNGCSFTFGEGFLPEDREMYNYDRLVATYCKSQSHNISLCGSSNYTIFMRSANALLEDNIDIMFVQWSALNRLWLSPGPDAYLFSNDRKHLDFTHRDLYISKEKLTEFRNMVMILNHDYQNILDLIDYCNILDYISSKTSTKIVFINGILPWTDDLDKPLTDDIGKDLSIYSKLILDFDNRDDDEIIKYFLKLQKKFQTLDKSKWVNLFDSFCNNIVDKGIDSLHPGKLSNQLMADKVIKHIIERKLL